MKRVLLICLCLSLMACQPEGKTIHGYIEGEFVMLSPTTGGLLETLSVERGQNVAAGDKLFALDITELEAKRAAAAAEMDRAEAQLKDLTKGDRPEELEVILKQKEQAQAALTNAKKEYKRIAPLVKTGASSQAALDNAKANLDSAQARLGELLAKIKTSNLGAREDQISAAQALVENARQSLAQAEKKLLDAAPNAPKAGRVEDTFFRPGEYVAAGQPVVSLLPPENVKVRFFVPQAMVPKLQNGQTVTINCDGCAEAIPAKISYISSEAQYTPPVIYSVESRDKLVFLIEAKFEKPATQLRPGLPVDITLEQ